MLAFLDRLCAALLARDSDEIRRLLRHPLAHALPRPVRAEAVGLTGVTRDGLTLDGARLPDERETASPQAVGIHRMWWRRGRCRTSSSDWRKVLGYTPEDSRRPREPVP